jgi:hypothetical protein
MEARIPISPHFIGTFRFQVFNNSIHKSYARLGLEYVGHKSKKALAL